ncbi:hypothetical protein [Desulfovibrio brasiliensis]
MSNGEVIRNVLLAVIAIGTLVVFFGFDLFDGKSEWFGSSKMPKVSFAGKINKRQIPEGQRQQLAKYLGENSDIFTNVSVLASKQDSYASGPKAWVLFEIHAELASGARLKTPTRRTTMDKLVPSIIEKLEKDARAYRKVHGGSKGKSNNTLINSM